MRELGVHEPLRSKVVNLLKWKFNFGRKPVENLPITDASVVEKQAINITDNIFFAQPTYPEDGLYAK